jgi:hypothetical protein
MEGLGATAPAAGACSIQCQRKPAYPTANATRMISATANVLRRASQRDATAAFCVWVPLRDFAAVCSRKFLRRASRSHAQQVVRFGLGNRAGRIGTVPVAAGGPHLGTRLGATHQAAGCVPKSSGNCPLQLIEAANPGIPEKNFSPCKGSRALVGSPHARGDGPLTYHCYPEIFPR